MSNLKRTAKTAITLLLLACMALTSGCYGSFALTHAVHAINGKAGHVVTDNEQGAGVVNSLVMIVFIVVPVYDLAMLGDALVVNSIEFWRGEKVSISVSDAETGGQATILADEAEGRATIASTFGEVELVRISPTVYDVRQDDVRLGHVELTESGSVRCYDAGGELLREIEG